MLRSLSSLAGRWLAPRPTKYSLFIDNVLREASRRGYDMPAALDQIRKADMGLEQPLFATVYDRVSGVNPAAYAELHSMLNALPDPWKKFVWSRVDNPTLRLPVALRMGRYYVLLVDIAKGDRAAFELAVPTA